MYVLGDHVSEIAAAHALSQTLDVASVAAHRGDHGTALALLQERAQSLADDSVRASIPEELLRLAAQDESNSAAVARQVPATGGRCLLLGQYTDPLRQMLSRANTACPSGQSPIRDNGPTGGARNAIDEECIRGLKPDATDDCWDTIVLHDEFGAMQSLDQFLRFASARLNPGGVIVANLPNRYQLRALLACVGISVDELPPRLLHLLAWPPLDEHGIVEWMLRFGWNVEDINCIQHPLIQAWHGMNNGRPISPFSEATRHVLRAVRCCETAFPLTSIAVVPVGSNLQLRSCLETIVTRTHTPYQLLVVGREPPDDPVGESESFRELRIVSIGGRHGFGEAANCGIAASTGQQVAVITTDTVVTAQWLEAQLAALLSDPAAGIVGPATNGAIGVQKASSDSQDRRDLERWARNWRIAHAGQRTIVPALTGSCFVLNREMIRKIGLFPEDLHVGPYDQIEDCMKASAAGFRCVVAMDAYVHRRRAPL